MTDFLQLIALPLAAYDEGLRYFQGVGMMNEALKQLANDLQKHGID